MTTWFCSTSLTLERGSGQAGRVLELSRALAAFVDVVLFAPLPDGLPVAMPANVRLVNVPWSGGAGAGLRHQIALYRAMQRDVAGDVYLAQRGGFNALGLWLARRRGMAALAQAHGIARNAVLDAASERLDYAALADGVVAVTEQVMEYVHARYGVPRSRILIAPNGSNPQTLRPEPAAQARSRLGIVAPGPVVGYVGSLDGDGGIETLVRGFLAALAERPDLTLLVVGRGREEDRLRGLVRLQGAAERIIWAGQQPYERVGDYLLACDILAAPFPLSAQIRATGALSTRPAEYLAAGRPVLASAVPGLEYVERQAVGRLCPPDDAPGFARVLLEMAANPQQLAAMGARARRLAETTFSWKSIARDVVDFAQAPRTRR